MANNNQSPIFDIDLEEINAIKDMVGASEKEMKLSYNRALKRTSVTISSLSAKLVRDEIGAKKLKTIRKRLRNYKSRDNNGLDSFRLWFGLNPFAVHMLKGSLTSQRNSGASFVPAAAGLQSVSDSRGFVLKVQGTKLMFIRNSSGKGDYELARVNVNDAVQDKIEDEIFDQIPTIFLKHYETDLKGRVAMRK